MTTDPFLRHWLGATKLRREQLGARTLDWAGRPDSFKTYPSRPHRTLPSPHSATPRSPELVPALARRRSRRELGTAPVSEATLAALLWACQGITGVHGPFALRTAPSAGALYPFETYVSVQNVDGWPPCLTHLDVREFRLEILSEGHHGRQLAVAALGQGFLAEAAMVVVWTSVLSRAVWKYGDRAVRYVGLDLGHVCQNLYLAAEAHGLAACAVAAFCDDEVNQILEVDGEEEFAYYMAAVGPRPIDTRKAPVL